MSGLGGTEARGGRAVEWAFLRACKAELQALKPGNVHRWADGHRMTLGDFERSAEAAASAIAGLGAMSGAGVGQRILAAVTATREAVGQNTNLGILLLAGPIAVAHDRDRPLPAVLRDLGPDDARAVFEAIRRANPGGLGRSDAHDVTGPAPASLLDAMRTAADRDRIAWNYVNDFEDVLGFGLGWPGDPDDPWTVTELYLAFLARTPDTHVRRKHGDAVATAVQERAVAMQHRFAKGGRNQGTVDDLLHWDNELKVAGINPGTSADLAVATLFARYLVARSPDP